MLYVALSQVKRLVDLQVLEPLSHNIVLKYFQLLGNVHLAKRHTFMNFTTHYLMHMFASCIMGK
jgi:hypothetical protein